MAKTRKNRSRRVRHGGQTQTYFTPAPTPAPTNASNLMGDIGSGAQKALDKTKEGFSWAFNKVFQGTPNNNTPAQSYRTGGRRKRRGGQTVVSFDQNWKEYGVIGGTRRKRRGGDPTGYSGKYGSNAASVKGGSRRRKRKY